MFQFWYLSLILFFVAGVCLIVIYLANRTTDKDKSFYITNPDGELLHSRERKLSDRVWYDFDVSALKATTVIVIVVGITILFL